MGTFVGTTVKMQASLRQRIYLGTLGLQQKLDGDTCCFEGFSQPRMQPVGREAVQAALFK